MLESGLPASIKPSAMDPSSMDMENFCGLLKLVSNPNRLRILVFLRHGEYAVGEIETGVGLKQPNLSHELRKLRDYGLVSTRRQSKVIFYSLSGSTTMQLVDGLAALCGRIGTEGAPGIDNDQSTNQPTATAKSRSLSDKQGECGIFSRVYRQNSTT